MPEKRSDKHEMEPTEPYLTPEMEDALDAAWDAIYEKKRREEEEKRSSKDSGRE